MADAPFPPPPPAGAPPPPPVGYVTPGYSSGPMGGMPRGSGRATASLVLGIISILLGVTVIIPVLAIVFGVLARKEINRSQGAVTGSGKATAGLITGIVGLLLGGLIITVAIVNRDKVALNDLEVGMCVNLPDGNQIKDAKKKSCDDPHDAEVFSTPKIDRPDGEPWPGLAEFQSIAAEECQSDYVAYVGANKVDDFAPDFIYPSRKGWEDNNERLLICFVRDPAGQLSKSVRAGG
jgi:hypothetical protein